MIFPFNIPPELLGSCILQQIPSCKLKIMLKNHDIFEYVQGFFPYIIKDCFTPVEPISCAKYNNAHDMKQYLDSEDIDLVNKVIIILNNEWCFINPLRSILKIIRESDQIDLILLVEKILEHKYSHNRRSPKSLAPLIKFFIDEMEYDPSVCDDYPILRASYEGHFQVVNMLIKDPRVNPAARDNAVIGYACDNGHFQIVKILLEDPRVEPFQEHNEIISVASENGYLQIVKMLLRDSRIDPSIRENFALKKASVRGHASIVKLLIEDPRVNPSANENFAIRWASNKGQTEVVKVLLRDSRVNPSAFNNEAINMASKNGHTDVVRILLNDLVLSQPNI